MRRESEIRFLQFAGRRVAYAVTGEGPALVAPAWWTGLYGVRPQIEFAEIIEMVDNS